MNKIPACGCGRSPTGKCIGWHNLSEEAFAAKQEAYKATKAAKAEARA